MANNFFPKGSGLQWRLMMDEPGFYISPEEIAAFAQMKAVEDIARIANVISPPTTFEQLKATEDIIMRTGKLGPGKIWNYNL